MSFGSGCIHYYYFGRLATRLLSLNSSLRANAANRVSIADLFEQTVRRHPQKTAIIFEDERWSFQQLDEYANRVAGYFLALGLKKGDVVALFMENCPEYVGVWVGLGKIGVVSAFINYNLRQEVLAHSIKVSKASAIVFGASLGEALGAVLSQLDEGVKDRCFAVKKGGTSPNMPKQAKDLQIELDGCPTSPPPALKDKGFEGRKDMCVSRGGDVRCVGSCADVRCVGSCADVRCVGSCADVRCVGSCADVRCVGSCADVRCVGSCADVRCVGSCADVRCVGSCADVRCVGSCADVRCVGSCADVRCVGSCADVRCVGSCADVRCVGSCAGVRCVGSCADVRCVGSCADVRCVGSCAHVRCTCI